MAVFRATSQLRADARRSTGEHLSPMNCLCGCSWDAWEMARYRICRAGAVVEPIAHEGAEMDNLNVQICTN